jgi:hypothetical protein
MTAPFQSIELSDAPHRRGVFMQSAHELFLGGDIKALWFNIKSFFVSDSREMFECPKDLPRVFFERTQKRSRCRNVRPSGTIGYEEEAKAESCGFVLQESAEGKRDRESIEPVSGTNL